MPFNSEHHSNFDDAAADTALDWDDGAPFTRHSWFARLHRHCYDEPRPVIITAATTSAATGAVTAAVTAAVRLYCVRAGSRSAAAPHSASALANWYSFSWAPSWHGTADRILRHTLLTSAFRRLRNHVARVSLFPVAQSDGTLDAVVGALADAGWRVIAQPTGQNHWVETGGRSFAEWWAMRPGTLRSTVLRKSKKARVALAIHDRFDDALWDDYETVYRQSWKPAESHPAFLRTWARDEAVNGRLRLGIARIDGAAVAAQFWTVDHGVAYIHKLAHIAQHDALSPGTLLTHAMFAHVFDIDHTTRIDFGTGDDGYKRDWMEHSAPLFTVEAWDLSQLSSWPSFVRATLSRLAARLRRV